MRLRREKIPVVHSLYAFGKRQVKKNIEYIEHFAYIHTKQIKYKRCLVSCTVLCGRGGRPH